MARLLALLVLIACLLPAGGCKRMTDRGDLCVVPEGAQPDQPRVLAADQPVEILVSHGCLSSSCDVERTGSCTITRAGNVLTVESTLSWRSNASGVCTDDCGTVTARCTSEPLPAGQYTIKLGDKTATIEVGGPDHGSCPDIQEDR